MKITDIPGQYFNNLIQNAQSMQDIAIDIRAMSGIDISQEVSTFPTVSQLHSMRQEGTILTNAQWEEFWTIIQSKEIERARASVQNAKYDAECAELNRTNPIQFDGHGHAYRNCRDYIEMGN